MTGDDLIGAAFIVAGAIIFATAFICYSIAGLTARLKKVEDALWEVCKRIGPRRPDDF